MNPKHTTDCFRACERPGARSELPPERSCNGPPERSCESPPKRALLDEASRSRPRVFCDSNPRSATPDARSWVLPRGWEDVRMSEVRAKIACVRRLGVLRQQPVQRHTRCAIPGSLSAGRGSVLGLLPDSGTVVAVVLQQHPRRRQAPRAVAVPGWYTEGRSRVFTAAFVLKNQSHAKLRLGMLLGNLE